MDWNAIKDIYSRVLNDGAVASEVAEPEDTLDIITQLNEDE